MDNLARIVDTQDEIIRIQSGVIDELFLLLLQHISADEVDKLPVIQRINKAAVLREEIGGTEP